MRSFSATALAYLANRGEVISKQLLWVKAKNLTTGASEPLGFWSGDQTSVFSINTVERTYAGEGAMLPLDPIIYEAGLSVRQLRVMLSPIHASVQLLIRGRNIGLVPAEIHRAFFDPLTLALIEEPHRVWKGFVNGAPITTAEIGGESLAEMTLVSSAQSLLRTLSLTKSDAVQTQRGGDGLRKYQDVSGSVKVWWGAAQQ